VTGACDCGTVVDGYTFLAVLDTFARLW